MIEIQSDGRSTGPNLAAAKMAKPLFVREAQSISGASSASAGKSGKHPIGEVDDRAVRHVDRIEP